MNRNFRRLSPLLLAAMLCTACYNPAAQPAQTLPAPAPTAPLQTTGSDVAMPDYDIDSMTEDAYIQYNAEPQIHSPMRSLVPPTGQQFSVYLREPMDRPSVEAALSKQDEDTLQPRLTFQWKDDRQLLVTADADPGSVPYGFNRYRLSVAGAKTQSGRVLENPPELVAAVEQPQQLWRVSLDGQTREELTGFDQPYRIDVLDDGTTLFLQRALEYCQCDAVHPRLYALYDTQRKALVSYPVELQRSYMGEGDFFADKRGFFYAKPASGVPVPQSDTAAEIKVDGYVHGASFTRDHLHVLMLVGEGKEANGSFRLVIQNLADGTQDHLEKEIVANAPTSQVSDARIPAVFHDDGEFAYFLMQKPGGGELYYQLNLRTQQTSSWATTDHPDAWYGVKDSTDRLYSLHAHAGLYRGEQKASDEMNLFNGEWIKGTHLIALLDYDDKAEPYSTTRAQIKLFDADRDKFQLIASRLPDGTDVLGSSEDGKWIYVSSSGDLNQN